MRSLVSTSQQAEAWNVPGSVLLKAGTQESSGPASIGIGDLEAVEMPFLEIEFG